MATESAPRAPEIRQTTACGLAVISMFIWGSPPTVARAISGEVPPVALVLGRWLIALIVLTPFVWREAKDQLPLLRQHWRALLLLALSMTAGSSLSVVAVYFTTATNAVLVNASQPAVTALLAWLVARERLARRQSAGIGLAFLGILVMISRAELSVLASFDINVGDLLMLAAVVGWSLYAVELHHQKRLPGSKLLLAIVALVGTTVLLPAYLIEAWLVGPFTITAEVSGAMIYLALFPTLLATYFWNIALRALGANRAAIFINLIPVFGAVFAMLFLGERLYAYHLLGAVFVFVGILLAARRV